MRMKWTGAVVALLGGCLLNACWYDPTEGPIFRPIAALMIAGGVIAFFEGLKLEIIAGVRQKERVSEDK